MIPRNYADAYRWAEWSKPPPWYTNEPPPPAPLSAEQNEALGRLADATWQRAVRFAAWFTGRQTDAEDIVQDALLRLMGNIGRYDLKGDGTGLVFAYVKSTARALHSPARKRPGVSLYTPTTDGGRPRLELHADQSAPRPDRGAHLAELWEPVRVVLARLSAAQLDELRGSLAGLPAEDVARMLEDPGRLESYCRSNRLFGRRGEPGWQAHLTAAELDRPDKEDACPHPGRAA